MSENSSPHPDALDNLAAIWRKIDAHLAGSSEMAATLPPEYAAIAVLQLAPMVVGCADRLLREYGLDISKRPPQWVSRWRPSSIDEFDAFQGLLMDYFFLDGTVRLIDQHVKLAPPERRGEAAMLGQIDAGKRLPPLLFQIFGRTSPYASEQANALLVLSARVRSRLSTRQNQRLGAAIEFEARTTGEAPKSVWNTHLLSETAVALGERDMGTWMQKEAKGLVNDVSTALEGLNFSVSKGRPKSVAHASDVESAREVFGASFSPEEETLAKLEVEARLAEDHRIWREARLSDQQISVLEYDRLGYKTGDIARILHTTSGNVSKQKNEARKRLRRFERDRARLSA